MRGYLWAGCIIEQSKQRENTLKASYYVPIIRLPLLNLTSGSSHSLRSLERAKAPPQPNVMYRSRCSMTSEEIDEQIRMERIYDLILSRTSEAVRVGENFYCMQCHTKDGRITQLRLLRSEKSKFNCAYCSSIKQWQPNENI